jgi:hypothetical protein
VFACLQIGIQKPKRHRREKYFTRAGTAGAVEAVAAAMRAHEESAGVQAAACTH